MSLLGFKIKTLKIKQANWETAKNLSSTYYYPNTAMVHIH